MKNRLQDRRSARPTRRAFIATAGAVLGCHRSLGARTTDEPLIVHLHDASAHGRDAIDGFILGFEEVERAAALLKRRVSQLSLDAGPDAIAVLAGHAERGRLAALISNAAGPAGREAAALAAGSGGVVVCGSERLTPTAASFMPPEPDVAGLVARWSATRNLRRWHLLADTSVTGQGLAAALRREAERVSADIVADAGLPDATGATVTLPAPVTGSDVMIVASGTLSAGGVAMASTGRRVPVAFCEPGVAGPNGAVSAHAEIWHGSLFRYGATQLNDRFERRFGRPMNSMAWAHWLSTKAAWEAMVRAPAGSPPSESLGRLPIDGQKGAALRFTPGGRLAQTIYLVERRTNAEGLVEETVADVPGDPAAGAGARRHVELRAGR